MNRTCTLTSLALFIACDSATPYVPTDGGDPIPAVPGETHSFDFEGDAAGKLPGSFVHVLGNWEVSADPDAVSGSNVLLQGGEFASPDYPRVLLESLTFLNPVVTVQCRMDSGSIDQACGVLFRAQDSENYYVTRANALEGNIRLYHVTAGDRQEFASVDIDVTASQWHTLEARATGSIISITWDGEKVMSVADETFPAAGKVGIWLKADSITAFDDFSATETAGK